MKQHISKVSRLVIGAFFLGLSACGGGNSDNLNNSDAASTETTSNLNSGDTVLLAQVQTSSPAIALPSVVAGFKIEVYANVTEPMKLSFGPQGALYTGRQGGDRIHRITRRGVVSEYGPPMADPDAVLVDATGLISGIRNSVLVGGGGGVLAAISPNQTATVIFNSGFSDVDDMQFDRRGRLIFSDDNPQVMVSQGQTPTVLFATPDRPGSIAIDDYNRIFVALGDGTIRIYNENGTVADSAFASGLATGLDTYIAFAPSAGGFGSALYVLSGSNLLRFDRRGNATVIGSGFGVGPSSGTGFVFGPDNALYVSDYNKNRVLKISRKRHQ